ncbi:MAG TPA: M20/M25/M40 family metallo-hydrolase [Paludibaculum sp.]|jgi:hypothetical protein
MKYLLLLALAASIAPAQEKIDAAANDRIRREAKEHSQVMQTAHVITDRFGARLTGSPAHEAAAKWAAARLTEWGLQNAKMEPWDFGHPGWATERSSGFLLTPAKDTLTFEVLSWTPSTKGAMRAAAVQIAPPEKVTAEELKTYLATVKDKVKGRIVLVGKAKVVPVSFAAGPSKRSDDATLKRRFDAANPQEFQRPEPPKPEPGKLTARQIDEQVDAFLVASKALVRVNDAAREHGQIRAFNNRTFDVAKAVPTVVLRNEDFGRIDRLLADGDAVTLEFNIRNSVYAPGKTSYNVVAEIPGTDKGDEVVILGGHLDSWHAATGATDNAIGSAVMMEAARILQALQLKPRRTIRVALWSGEEQGLLGSKAYVKQHYGTFENPTAEYAKVAAYLNCDTGTGRIRGASVFGPAEAGTVFREALAPFADLAVAGATSSKTRREGGSDHTSFSVTGLPGVGLATDMIEYMTHTWHTNLDTYERLVPEDAIQSSTVVAALAWHLANREQMVPRFTKETMPAPPPPPAATPKP